MGRNIIITEDQFKRYCRFLREHMGRNIYITQKQYDYIIKEGIKQELAKLRKEVNTNPTDAQKEAGNYKKGHISIRGFEITIEQPKGSYRRGTDSNGTKWKTLMHNDYGYFSRTLGKDGDAIDVFIGPNPEKGKIFPIDQFINGEFDETKIMFGFDSAKEAKKAYLSNYSKDWNGFKYISEVDIDSFKTWLYDGKKQRKPFAKYKGFKKPITESQYRRIVLNEDKVTDTIKRYIKANNPFGDQMLATRVAELNTEVQSYLQRYESRAYETSMEQGLNLLSYLRLCFLHRFYIGNGKGPSEYYAGLARIGLQELGMFSRMDTDNDVTALRDIALYMHRTDNPNVKGVYDANFNGLSYNELVTKVKPFMDADLAAEKNRLMGASDNNDYRIVPISSYEEAAQYGRYTGWCVTHGQDAYDTYTKGGNRFYFCLQNGFENVPKEQTENCPLDTYGLSMIAVLVDTQGSPVHITTRWNHDHEGEDNPNFHTAEQVQKITHINFYRTFKPYTEEELLAIGVIPFSRVQQILDSGRPLKNIFEDIGTVHNGFARVALNDKYNFINTEKKLLSNTWFDYASYFRNGSAQVKLNNKWNFINIYGQLVSDTWFDYTYVGKLTTDGSARVELNGKWNLINTEGKLLSNTWFDYVDNFINGFATVNLNGKYNFINTEGKLLSNTWFDKAGDFENGSAPVILNGNYRIIDTDGTIS